MMSRKGRYKNEKEKPLSSINFGYNVELERNRKACIDNSSKLADDAFAHDVVEEDTGKYYHRETHVVMGRQACRSGRYWWLVDSS